MTIQILRLRGTFADFKTACSADFKTAELFLQILRLRDYAGLKTAALETSLQK